MRPTHTPGVYVEEIATYPASVAQVETAVPAFIGYTQTAQSPRGEDLTHKPWKVRSLEDYELLFGLPHADVIAVTVTGGLPEGYRVVVPVVEPKFTLHHAVRMFFDNGGGQCYIVSVGNYSAVSIEVDKLRDGLDEVALEEEPTLIVIPEAVKLGNSGYQTLMQAALKQCGDLGDRFTIIDVWRGDQKAEDTVTIPNPADPNNSISKKVIEINRDAWTGALKYGAAYYPFLRTTIPYYVLDDDKNVIVGPAPAGGAAPTLDTLRTSDTGKYNAIRAALRNHYITMPPSGAIAGVYAATDGARGVWKAPANVALAGVIEPVVRLNIATQDPLNVDATSGKSINAIRAFTGKGTLVWGARTLEGNSNEWRYVSVRRFFNMVEESIQKSTYWAVFESNDANTWVKVRGMIENFLTDKWRDGALAGATTKEAFYVRCGLGTTMNAQHILEGTMNVEIGMAVVRPAEFIVLKFSHKLQTS